VPISAPVVVGPGRIRLLTRSGLDQARRGGRARAAPEQRFALVDITLAGSELRAEGECPEHSRPVGLALAGPGLGAISCGTPAVPEVHIGFVQADGSRIDWHKEQIEHRSKHRGVAASHYLADLNGRFALLVEPIGSKGLPLPPWAVHLAPGPPGYEPLCSDGGSFCPEQVVALIVTKGALHVLMTTDATAYTEFVVGSDGSVSSRDALESAQLRAGSLEASCVSQGEDGSVTVMAGLSGADRSGDRVMTLRYADATLPVGPHVYPTERAACAPARWAGSSSPPLRRRDVRATLGQSSLVVYTLPPVMLASPAETVRRLYPGSFRVYRGLTGAE
jgi:hypothetical protein